MVWRRLTCHDRLLIDERLVYSGVEEIYVSYDLTNHMLLYWVPAATNSPSPGTAARDTSDVANSEYSAPVIDRTSHQILATWGPEVISSKAATRAAEAHVCPEGND